MIKTIDWFDILVILFNLICLALKNEVLWFDLFGSYFYCQWFYLIWFGQRPKWLYWFCPSLMDTMVLYTYSKYYLDGTISSLVFLFKNVKYCIAWPQCPILLFSYLGRPIKTLYIDNSGPCVKANISHANFTCMIHTLFLKVMIWSKDGFMA